MPPVETVRPDGPKIRALIRANGYSVSGLGRSIGRHPQTISDVVRGRQAAVSIPLLFQIARALHVAPGEISDYAGSGIESAPEPKGTAA